MSEEKKDKFLYTHDGKYFSSAGHTLLSGDTAIKDLPSTSFLAYRKDGSKVWVVPPVTVPYDMSGNQLVPDEEIVRSLIEKSKVGAADVHKYIPQVLEQMSSYMKFPDYEIDRIASSKFEDLHVSIKQAAATYWLFMMSWQVGSPLSPFSVEDMTLISQAAFRFTPDVDGINETKPSETSSDSSSESRPKNPFTNGSGRKVLPLESVKLSPKSDSPRGGAKPNLH